MILFDNWEWMIDIDKKRWTQEKRIKIKVWKVLLSMIACIFTAWLYLLVSNTYITLVFHFLSTSFRPFSFKVFRILRIKFRFRKKSSIRRWVSRHRTVFLIRWPIALTILKIANPNFPLPPLLTLPPSPPHVFNPPPLTLIRLNFFINLQTVEFNT